MLATDLLRLAWDNLYDEAVVVSGDGDFAYAVQAAKDMGKHVEVAAFTANLSGELAQVADHRESFTPEYFKDLWMKGRSTRSNSRRSSNGSGGRGRSLGLGRLLSKKAD